MKKMMKKKKFSGLIALAMCVVLALCSGAWAVLLRYDENDQQWRNLEIQQVPWRSGSDPDNDYYGTNCFALIKWIVEIEGRGTINSYTNNGRVLDSFTGGVLVAQYLNDQKNAYPTAETVRSDFSKAHLGDVVQMRWKYTKSTQHTAMINGFDDNGVYFFQSHVSGTGVKKIKNSYYSYADLAQRYSNAGSDGGYSIYYFAAPVPDDTSARDKVVAYAEQIHNHKWNTNGYVLMYTKNPYYDENGKVKFSSNASWNSTYESTPVVATGWVRGIPYTLQYGGVEEKSFADYKSNDLDKTLISNIYTYGGSRISARYGMACATFVTDCIRQGFKGYDNSLGTFTSVYFGDYRTDTGESGPWRYKKHSSGKYYVEEWGVGNYKNLQKGDYLRNGDHVMLVIYNDGSNNIEVIDQTPRNWGYMRCPNRTYKTVYLNGLGEYYAEVLCMRDDCDTCKKYTMGTARRWFTYSDLERESYRAKHVNYPDDSTPESDGISIDAEHFPDSYFREYVKNFDTNGDGYFSQNELDAVTEMWEENGPHPDNGNPNNGNYGYEWIKIESIEGIKYFRNLKSLCVYRDNIKEIDLSGMEHLEKLYCYGNTKDEGYGNKLTKLNLKNCSSLQELRCEYNQIQTLDLEGCTALRNLNAVNNQLKTLNLKGCKSLYELYATNNKLTEINVDGCTSLQFIYVGKNSFKELRLSAMSAVRYIAAHKNTALKSVYVNNNPTLQTLVLNDCPALERVYATNSSSISGINIDGDTNLRIFERAPNVTVPGNKPTITTNSLPDAVLGKFYKTYIKADSNTSIAGNTPVAFLSNATAHANGVSFDVVDNLSDKWYSAPNGTSQALFAGMAGYANGGNTPIPNRTYPCKIHVNITAKNYVGETTKSFTLTIREDTSRYAPKITSDTLSGKYYTGTYYDIPFTASGASPVTWEISSGILPQGLTLNKNTGRITGTISSTPETREGSSGTNLGKEYPFSITAKNNYGSDVQTNKLVVIEPLRITTENLPSGKRGEAYRAELECIGSYSYLVDWKIISGRLPNGLNFSSSRRRKGTTISGTPSEAGTFPITVQVSGSAGLEEKDRSFSIVIKEPLTGSGTFSNGYLNKSYSSSVSASGGVSPYTWTKSSGTLPTGLTLNKSTGNLSGTPTARGTYNFTLKVTDKNGANITKSFTVKITGPAISGTFKNWYINMPYSSYINIIGDGTSPYTAKLYSGNLPVGIKLTYSGTKVTLSGTPTKTGTYTFKIKIKDRNGANVTQQFTVKIREIKFNGSLSNGALKNSYSGKLTLSDGDTPYTLKIESGNLPAGMTLKVSGSTVTISGKPTKAGKYTFKLKATDKNGATATKSYTVTITKPTITGTLSVGTVGKSYSKTLKATGGTAPYTWTKSSGALPTGLTLNKSTGKISGKPTAAGTFTFKVKVTDKNGATATKSYTVKITKPAISGSLSNGVIKKSYSKTLTASGGTAPYTWTKSSGTLPTGLTLNKSTGKISGKPTAAGTFTFKVKVTDKNGATATKSYTVTITKPSISGTLSAGTVGKSYSKTLKAAGGTASYTWTKASGTLPSGLKLGKTTGKISGTPTKAGKFTFKIKVTDKNGATATKSFTVTIKAASSSGKEIEQDDTISEDVISESESENENENTITEIESELMLNVQSAKEEHDANSYYVTALHVMSDDVISQGTERDEDLVSVKANQPVRFIIGTWPREVSDERVYVDDELIEEIEIKEGTFTLPAEFVHDDFKISVKAKADDSELESEEIYISSEE